MANSRQRTAARAIQSGTAFRNPITPIVEDIREAAALPTPSAMIVTSAEINQIVAEPNITTGDWSSQLSTIGEVYQVFVDLDEALTIGEMHVDFQISELTTYMRQVSAISQLLEEFGYGPKQENFFDYYGIMYGQFDPRFNEVLNALNLIQENADTVDPYITATNDVVTQAITFIDTPPDPNDPPPPVPFVPTPASTIDAALTPLLNIVNDRYEQIPDEVKDAIVIIKTFNKDLVEKTETEAQNIIDLPQRFLELTFVQALPETGKNDADIRRLLERTATNSLAQALVAPNTNDAVEEAIASINKIETGRF